MTTKESIVAINKDISSLNDKMDNFDDKLDNLTLKLLDPDDGVTARVNKNTSMRKIIVRAVWGLYGLTLGAIATIIRIFTIQ
tara:strand:+ start:1012 stop:1257 length:246 start_codon:yes stop_codon:yes gene_type:complete